VKFAPKRSAPKWTSNKMGNAKKEPQQNGPRQSGRAIQLCTHKSEKCCSIKQSSNLVEKLKAILQEF